MYIFLLFFAFGSLQCERANHAALADDAAAKVEIAMDFTNGISLANYKLNVPDKWVVTALHDGTQIAFGLDDMVKPQFSAKGERPPAGVGI